MDNGQTNNQQATNYDYQQTNSQPPPMDNGNQQTADNNQQTDNMEDWQGGRYVSPPPPTFEPPAAVDSGSPADDDWTKMMMNNMLEPDPLPAVPDEVRQWRGQQQLSPPPHEGTPQHHPAWFNPAAPPHNDLPHSDESPPTNDMPTNQEHRVTENNDIDKAENQDMIEQRDSSDDVGGANQQSVTPPMNYQQPPSEQELKEESAAMTTPTPLPSVLNDRDGSSDVKDQPTSDPPSDEQEQVDPVNEPGDTGREEVPTQQNGQEKPLEEQATAESTPLSDFPQLQESSHLPEEWQHTTTTTQQPSQTSDIPPSFQQQPSPSSDIPPFQQQEYSSHTPEEQQYTTQELPPQPSPSVGAQPELTPSFTPGLEQWSDQPINDQNQPDQQASNQPINDQNQPDQQASNQPINDQNQPITDQNQPITDQLVTESSSTTVFAEPSYDPVSPPQKSRQPVLSETPVHYHRDAGRGFSFEERDMECPPCSVPVFLQLAYNIVPETIADQLIAMVSE